MSNNIYHYHYHHHHHHHDHQVIKRIGEVADGVFQFSELHECGGEWLWARA